MLHDPNPTKAMARPRPEPKVDGFGPAEIFKSLKPSLSRAFRPSLAGGPEHYQYSLETVSDWPLLPPLTCAPSACTTDVRVLPPPALEVTWRVARETKEVPRRSSPPQAKRRKTPLVADVRR